MHHAARCVVPDVMPRTGRNSKNASCSFRTASMYYTKQTRNPIACFEAAAAACVRKRNKFSPTLVRTGSKSEIGSMLRTWRNPTSMSCTGAAPAAGARGPTDGYTGHGACPCHPACEWHSVSHLALQLQLPMRGVRNLNAGTAPTRKSIVQNSPDRALDCQQR